MLNEAYCSFELSKLLKENGFNIPTLTYYIPYEDGDVKFFIDSKENFWNSLSAAYPWMVSAPTHQRVAAWLRDIHDIYIEITRGYEHFFIRIIKMHPYKEYDLKNDTFDIYEDAMETALKYVIENLIINTKQIFNNSGFGYQGNNDFDQGPKPEMI